MAGSEDSNSDSNSEIPFKGLLLGTFKIKDTRSQSAQTQQRQPGGGRASPSEHNRKSDKTEPFSYHGFNRPRHLSHLPSPPHSHPLPHNKRNQSANIPLPRRRHPPRPRALSSFPHRPGLQSDIPRKNPHQQHRPTRKDPRHAIYTHAADRNKYRHRISRPHAPRASETRRLESERSM